MNLISSLLDKLPKLKTAAEFAAVLPELEDQLLAAEAAEVDLNERLGIASFESPAKVEEVEKAIAENKALQNRLRAQIKEADRRRQEAAAAELGAAIEKRMKDAKKLQAKLRGAYINLDSHLSAAGPLVDEICSDEEELREFNKFAVDNGRPDLVVASPWEKLMQLIGDSGQASETPRQGYANGVRGYFPRHPRGPAMARMKEVKL
ncbi:hypothetical protein [uncultured Bradyrhizobium sp.]|jgi:enamine deaminase RidA (YjgF/YER057c/UK114 family)|uniref:hypothetical protein n=1 Tax=uncultured Bradyrhizobium sp. TaxID=199684 RepID=UPI002619EBCC|nr:hypothetical protein [uncultured Bradyrhizobium sp.]